jgi:hypothetical protein
MALNLSTSETAATVPAIIPPPNINHHTTATEKEKENPTPITPTLMQLTAFVLSSLPSFSCRRRRIIHIIISPSNFKHSPP